VPIFKPAEHELVNIADVERRTGRSSEDLLLETGVQSLVRISRDGSREEMLRIPVRLLLGYEEEPAKPKRAAKAAGAESA
jgi:hypothetical protein